MKRLTCTNGEVAVAEMGCNIDCEPDTISSFGFVDPLLRPDFSPANYEPLKVLSPVLANSIRQETCAGGLARVVCGGVDARVDRVQATPCGIPVPMCGCCAALDPNFSSARTFSLGVPLFLLIIHYWL